MLAPTSNTWTRRLGPALVAVMLVAGCSTDSAGQDPGEPTGERPSQASASAPHSPDTEQEAGMITFAVEGGFTNQMRSVSIKPDGTAEAEVSGRSVRGELDPDRVAQILAALQSSGLFDETRTYSASTNAADLQRYEISYDGVTVVAYDTTVPPELTEAVGLLEQALRDVQR